MRSPRLRPLAIGRGLDPLVLKLLSAYSGLSMFDQLMLSHDIYGSHIGLLNSSKISKPQYVMG